MITDKKNAKAKQERRVATLKHLLSTLDDLETNGFYYNPHALDVMINLRRR
jgi:hypothetical protein